jgi:hypothetical protein
MMDLEFQVGDVEVVILQGPYLKDGKATTEAIRDYTSIIERLEEFKTFAASQLLTLYNDQWVVDEIGPVDEEGFKKRLCSPAVHLYDEVGSAIVYFEDGDLFAGHYIEIITKGLRPSHAHLAG